VFIKLKVLHKAIGKTKKHNGTSNEIRNMWHFKQHVCVNIWSMVSLSTNEYFTILGTFLVYGLL
jgi:hypothetical protein